MHKVGIAICSGFMAATVSMEAQADVVISPVIVSASASFPDAHPVGLVWDQSGLNSNYVAGVTDFSAFVATTTSLTGVFED